MATEYLYMISESAGIHATGDIDRVAPDVILRLVCSNDPGDRWAVVQSCTYDTVSATNRTSNMNVHHNSQSRDKTRQFETVNNAEC